jgi:hypothetical protein
LRTLEALVAELAPRLAPIGEAAAAAHEENRVDDLEVDVYGVAASR